VYIKVTLARFLVNAFSATHRASLSPLSTFCIICWCLQYYSAWMWRSGGARSTVDLEFNGLHLNLSRRDLFDSGTEYSVLFNMYVLFICMYVCLVIYLMNMWLIFTCTYCLSNLKLSFQVISQFSGSCSRAFLPVFYRKGLLWIIGCSQKCKWSGNTEGF